VGLEEPGVQLAECKQKPDYDNNPGSSAVLCDIRIWNLYLHFSVWLKATQMSNQERQEAEAAGEVKGGTTKILDIVRKTFYAGGLTT
jgi:hypothetical protein